MFSFIVAFLISFFICLLIIRYKNLHLRLTHDPLKGGPQKFHRMPTPRIGGVALFTGVLCASVVFFIQRKEFAELFFKILLCSTPLVMGGLIEDLTKKVSARLRFFLCILSATFAFLVADVRIVRLDIILIDEIIQILPLSFLISIIGIVGLTNAVNIIDGFNGLASGVAVIILAGLSYVAFKTNDIFIFFCSAVLISVILGFFLWNYPRGLIFLGDSGAYFIGFFIAVFSILLVKRNPQISPWFPLLLAIYPVWETIFSIYRRKFIKNLSPFNPDGIHFHTLIYKRILKWAVGAEETRHLTKRNSTTSIYLWALTFVSFVPAVLFWENSLILQISVVLWISMYVWLYRKIVRFKTPKYLLRRTG